MHLSRAGLLALVVSFGGCRSCADKAARPADEPVLTERDVDPGTGAVRGDGWVWPLDARWYVVKEATRQRFNPHVHTWVVDPSTAINATVACRAPAGPPETSLRAQLEPVAQRQEASGLLVAPAGDGPWIDGALAHWQQGPVQHALVRVLLVSRECDVHAWGPQAAAPPLAHRLRSAVLAFAGTQPKLLGELRALAGFWRAKGSASPDAGVVDAALSRGLTSTALRHLAPGPLVERFEMRRAYLDGLSDAECARLVRHQLEPSAQMLERLPDATAARWVQLTREALEHAERLGPSPPPPPEPAQVKAALAPLLEQDELLRDAVTILQQGDAPPDDAVCSAEKVRLDRLLALPEAPRTLLLRSLLGS